MSLKSFDDFCARIINNDPVQQKHIFDERQTLVRSQITIRALWLFIITSGINILIMECGPQWCESYVLSTAIFGALAVLYWVSANARHETLFGINGTMSASSQAWIFFADGLLIPIVFITHDDADFSNIFFRSGMVSEYLATIIAGILLCAAAFVMFTSLNKYKKRLKNEENSDDT